MILRALFRVVERAPWFPRRTRWLWLLLAWRLPVARPARQRLRANAARLLGRRSSTRQRKRLALAIARQFYDFVVDLGEHSRMTPEQLLSRITRVEGADRYDQARRHKKGAIVATAHFGSFELGMAAIAERERRAHVVFARDPYDRFEAIRSSLRRRLRVCEARVEEGWPMWLRLRDALAADEVVLMQADRVMPGQRGEIVKFFDGHIRLPTGAVRLAMLSEAPLIPVFSRREPTGGVAIVIENPIIVSHEETRGMDPHAALERYAHLLEQHARNHPEQWLMPEVAWVEDRQAMGLDRMESPSDASPLSR